MTALLPGGAPTADRDDRAAQDTLHETARDPVQNVPVEARRSVEDHLVLVYGVVVVDVDNDEEGHGIAVDHVYVPEEDGREVGLLLGPTRTTDME